jgi:FAD/FMN-containing dehydrogenase
MERKICSSTHHKGFPNFVSAKVVAIVIVVEWIEPRKPLQSMASPRFVAPHRVCCNSAPDGRCELAAQHRVPMTPFGVRSSLEGHSLAVQGGISIDLGRVNHILTIHPEHFTFTDQSGVTRQQLNDALKSSRLFFPE